MEIKSYLMSDTEVMCAVDMFVTENMENGSYVMTNREEIDNLEEYIKRYDEMIPEEFIQQCSEFNKSLGDDWQVFIMTTRHTPTELCGVIGFKDYGG